ncbi:MAG: MFS transporter [Defluviitaleaceae bacterium]|nr:MFS transporter [Defluviitaleaceae bacterium]
MDKNIIKPAKKFNEKLLYAYKFIGECLPIYAFYTVLFIERGMSVTQIAVLIALWSVFAIVFEIPSGILADRWNRRNMLAIASALQGVCFFIWIFSHSFWTLALGFMFWAIGGAFGSGTEEGLIYDNLKNDGKEENFTKIYGKAKFFASVGTIFGIVSAGVIEGFINIEAIAFISAGICLVNVFFAMRLREVNFYSDRVKKGADEKPQSVFETFKEAGFFIKGSGVALVAILFLIFFAGLGGYLDEFDALIVADFGLSYTWVSVILTVRFVFIAIGDLIAPYMQKKIKSVKQIFLLNGLSCALLLVFAFFWNQYALLIFGFAFMFMAVSEILLVNALQNEIKEEGRATVMSFCDVGQNVGMICLSMVYAVVARLFPLQYMYVFVSVYGIAGGLAFYFFTKLAKR